MWSIRFRERGHLYKTFKARARTPCKFLNARHAAAVAVSLDKAPEDNVDEETEEHMKPRPQVSLHLQKTRTNPTGRYAVESMHASPQITHSTHSNDGLAAENPNGKYSNHLKRLRFSYLLNERTDVVPIEPDRDSILSLEQAQLVSDMMQGHNIYFTGAMKRMLLMI